MNFFSKGTYLISSRFAFRNLEAFPVYLDNYSIFTNEGKAAELFNDVRFLSPANFQGLFSHYTHVHYCTISYFYVLFTELPTGANTTQCISSTQWEKYQNSDKTL